MPNQDPQRVNELRTLIADFLKRRLDIRLEKIKGDDEKAIAEQKKEHDRFEKNTWFESAAQRTRQIQLVTHVLKATYPDIKINLATNLYASPRSLHPYELVGSHVLGDHFDNDATGNAAALDIYDFLTQRYGERTILELVRDRDTDLNLALSNDKNLASRWMQIFSEIVESPCSRLTSHTFAKQFYWLIDNELDPHDDASFHLLAPLYASSLAHRVYLRIQDDRFSEGANAARKAKKEGAFSDRPVCEYPQLAIQKIGGTKPQNISQLNSERGGNNFLLASLPPLWRSVDIKPLLGTDSMFDRYGWRPEVKKLVRTLLAFFKSDPARNLDTRERRDELVNDLIDEFWQFSAELQSLEPGWSQVRECHLGGAEKHWLDPDGVVQSCTESGLPLPTDTLENVSRNFANWLNHQLRDPLAMGDPEFMHWRKLMLEQLKEEEREGRHDN